jgi:hypothetical protein
MSAAPAGVNRRRHGRWRGQRPHAGRRAGVFAARSLRYVPPTNSTSPLLLTTPSGVSGGL